MLGWELNHVSKRGHRGQIEQLNTRSVGPYNSRMGRGQLYLRQQWGQKVASRDSIYTRYNGGTYNIFHNIRKRLCRGHTCIIRTWRFTFCMYPYSAGWTCMSQSFRVLCSEPEQTVEQTVYLPLIWDVMILMQHHCNKYRVWWHQYGKVHHSTTLHNNKTNRGSLFAMGYIRNHVFLVMLILSRRSYKLIISPWIKGPSFRSRYLHFFANEKFCIFIKISIKFIIKCPTGNNPALV